MRMFEYLEKWWQMQSDNYALMGEYPWETVTMVAITFLAICGLCSLVLAICWMIWGDRC